MCQSYFWLPSVCWIAKFREGILTDRLTRVVIMVDRCSDSNIPRCSRSRKTANPPNTVGDESYQRHCDSLPYWQGGRCYLHHDERTQQRLHEGLP